MRKAVVVLWYTGADAPAVRRWVGEGIDLASQPSGDLGRRLEEAFATSFAAGAAAAVAIGTDCPDLTPEIIAEAGAALADVDLVLGPATDGGYYLIGLRTPAPPLFREVAWGQTSVLAETLDRAAAIGLSHRLLRTLADVDRPEDLSLVRDLVGDHDQT
jgi:rSAM/selenodomain-associated transferase 1